MTTDTDTIVVNACHLEGGKIVIDVRQGNDTQYVIISTAAARNLRDVLSEWDLS